MTAVRLLTPASTPAEDIPDYIPRESGPMTVTPQLALLWIRHLINPRTVSEYVLDSYARDMKAGNWPLNGESIKWDVDHNCIDGDHRLRACILAGVPFQTWVLVGLPKGARDSVDQGYRRRIAQVLRARGERYSTNIAGAAVLLWRWQRGREALIEHKTRPTLSETNAVLDAHPRLRESVELCHGSLGKASRLSRSSTVPSFVHYMGGLNQGIDAPTRFVEQVHLGTDIGAGDPAYALRERLIRMNSERNRFAQREVLALWVPAWNAFAAGKRLKRLLPMDYNDPEQLVIL